MWECMGTRRRFVCMFFLGVSVALLATGCSFFGTKSDNPDQPKAESENKQTLFEVKVGGKFGYIDKAGKLAITPQFDKVEDFREGLAAVCLGKCGFDSKPDESRYGYIDQSGKYVVNPTYDHVHPFSEGLAAVCSGDCWWGATKGRKWGFIDKKGAVVIPLQFGDARYFKEGLAAVCVGTCIGHDEKFEGKWGYIDAKGAFVIN